MNSSKTDTILSKSNSWRMFDQISSRYDFLNHLLSFGLDISWRARLTHFLPTRAELKVLDVATGTADVLLSCFKHNKNIQTGHGIDMAERMMDIGRIKIARAGFESHIILHHGDANQIPFNDHTFDAATIAFGIRNMEDPVRVLNEMHRVLNKEGRALILEFSLPKNPVIRCGHLFYLRYLVPLIGAVFSGQYQAYRYLNQTIETFPYGDAFCALMEQAGFKNVAAHPLLFGVATIYSGDKN